MSQKDMLVNYIIRPILIEPFEGIFHHFYLKLFILVGGFPTAFAFDLFQTPELWWKGLIWLVILDWVGGVIVSIKKKRFKWKEITRKWYQVTGYLIVCISAAVISNGLTAEVSEKSFWQSIFYGFQYAVYISFFLKEFISILDTWRLTTIFFLGWEVLKNRKAGIDTFGKFRDEVDRRDGD